MAEHSPDYFSWWQRPDLCYQDDQLFFAGISVNDLIAEHGTPTFVYSGQRVAANLQRLKNALNATALKNRYSILYAMKANRYSPLLQLMRQQDSVGIDACSPNEVALAVKCGFSPAQISFTAGSLSQKDVARLSEFHGLSLIHI